MRKGRSAAVRINMVSTNRVRMHSSRGAMRWASALSAVRMHSSRRAILWATALMVAGVGAIFFPAGGLFFRAAAQPQPQATAQTETAWGLHTATFKTAKGTLTVNLPDDAAAGDTIRGTVLAEPAGRTAAERKANLDELNGYVLELGEQEIQAGEPWFTHVLPAAGAGAAEKLSLKSARRQEMGSTQIPVRSSAPSAAEPGTLHAPEMVQAGRPAQFAGSFDVLAPTAASIGGQNVVLLGQSPRQTILRCPATVTGPAPYHFQNGSWQANGSLWSVRVEHSTNKQMILKNEEAEVVLTVRGVKGLEKDLPIEILNKSKEVVRMSGGDEQRILIPKDAVQNQDVFQQIFKMTGLRTGGFAVSAFLANEARQPGSTTAPVNKPQPVK